MEAFKFLKRYRERKAAERQLEMAHQLSVVDRLAGMIESLSEGQSKQITEVTAALVEIARSNQAQAEGFTTWLKSFQLTESPTSSVIREEDELREEQARLLDDFGLGGESIPEEFRLALQLQKGISSLGDDHGA